jgi:hypothetical protein
MWGRKIRPRRLSAIFLPGIFRLPPIFERIPPNNNRNPDASPFGLFITFIQRLRPLHLRKSPQTVVEFCSPHCHRRWWNHEIRFPVLVERLLLKALLAADRGS